MTASVKWKKQGSAEFWQKQYLLEFFLKYFIQTALFCNHAITCVLVHVDLGISYSFVMVSFEQEKNITQCIVFMSFSEKEGEEC